jgi:hypothetical protein
VASGYHPDLRDAAERPPILKLVRQKLLLCIFILAQSISISSAGVRHFTFLYEANTSAPGSFELENWVTWQRANGAGRFDQVDFRHELEYGVTEKFQLSIYLADWFYENDREHSGSTYSDSAIELIYIGPNVSFRHRNWFVTVTTLAQATNTEDEPDFQLRTIFGIGF